MKKHRFILEPYSGMDCKTMCPCCRHRRNTFKRYIDTDTQQYLADHVGMCDRIDSCGYHFTPREFFKTNPDKKPGANVFPHVQPEQRETKDYKVLPWHYVEDSLRSYQHNHFIRFLIALFNVEQALKLAHKYYIGTASHWHGATIFWQVDSLNRVRTGKIMLYNPEDCHRVKEHITWVHTLVVGKSESRESPKDNNEENLRTSGLADFRTTINIKQCLFGEHLLKADPHKIVAIAESEKTAVIANIYHPDYVWLGAGSLNGLTLDRCKALKGRRVILYPDVNGYTLWQQKAHELNVRMPDTTFSTSDYLERTATPQEKQRGIDIADRWIDELLLQREVEKEWGLRE